MVLFCEQTFEVFLFQFTFFKARNHPLENMVLSSLTHLSTHLFMCIILANQGVSGKFITKLNLYIEKTNWVI